MPSLRARWTPVYLKAVCLALAISFLPTLLPAQGTGGRILGRVADPSGAVLGAVKITAVNDATGAARVTQTSASGDYGFPDLPVGSYTLTFELAGFKKDVHKNITLDVNQVITLNMTMQLGAAQEIVDVTSEAPLVDTTSTQLGAVVNNRSVNELPLNARDTYQFLQLQPGVQSQLGSSGGTFYGSDDAGAVSVNGGRGRANNFSVNGGDANDQFVNLPTIQPTPDAIEEFRVISNTFDAEYGRNSGAVVNVITKSGTNQWHGDVYEYFRNTVLNAQGFFNTVKPQENQNQFGGTFGGPIKKDRTFFFTSYEGRRVRQGISGQTVIVPTPQERTGVFGGGNGFGGAITDQFTADALNGRPGCTAAIAAEGGQMPAATVNWSSIFPTDVNGNATIPTPCMDPVAVDMLRFVPAANRSDGLTYQAVPVSADTQNQFTIRLDHHINQRQNFSFYYYFTNDANFQPFYDFQASGANIPGFGANVGSRYQQYNPSHTWTISNSLINEARFTYMREGQLTFQHPQSTNLVQNSCLSPAAQAVCFNGVSDSNLPGVSIQADLLAAGLPATSPQYGITTGLPANRQGVPFIGVSGGFAIGNGWEGELPQVGNSFMWTDSMTWVKASHTIKFGADVRRSRFDQTLYYNVSGEYTFNSTTENSVFYNDNYPGYLLGLDDSYTQGSAQREDIRNTGVYVFAQDSWKIKPSLTLNYGLRWELDTPLADALHHVQTFRPGQNSTVFPCMLTAAEQANLMATNCTAAGVQPTGLVVPGDSGVPAGLTQTYYKAFAPRIGLAYSFNPKTTIRGGWGLFYNPMEQLVLEQFGAEPPFGGSTFLPATFLNTPFISQTGSVSPNPFTGILNPTRGTAQDWASFRPMLLYGDFQPHMRTQYTAQYNLNFQQELARNVVFQLGYVGSQGHRLLASHDINPANPQTCLDIISIANANAANVSSFGSSATCGPFLEDNQYTVTLPAANSPALLPNGFHLPTGGTIAAAGQTLNFVGLRPYSTPTCNPVTGGPGNGCPADGVPVFTNIFAEDTIAPSAYNSLQASLEKRFSHGLQLQAAYTWSKSLDWASSFEETVDPFDYKASRALSLFNSAQRFVLNYYWEFPVQRFNGFKGRVLDDWAMSGIIQFQTGFPIRIQTQDDDELISSLFFLSADAPQLTGPLQKQSGKQVTTQVVNGAPETGHFSINASSFSDPPQGQFSTTPRSICCGPGQNEWDVTFSKKIALSEAKYFQFRADIFNLFNKTQFVNPDGNFSDTTFGQIQQARDPREVQVALKFYF